MIRMISLRYIASFENNVFIKKITKWHKLRQILFREFHISTWDGQTLKDSKFKKIPIYRELASRENLNIDDYLIKEQDAKEVEIIFKEIAQDDAEVEQQLMLLLYEIMIKRAGENQVPKHLKKNHWEELLKLSSLAKRNKYLNFLFKTEKKKESARLKDALKKRDDSSIESLLQNVPHINYGLTGYSMFLRIYPKTITPLLDIKALTNKLSAPPILFDCSYQDYMDTVKTKLTAQQMKWSIQQNRMHPNPCTLQFFNLKKNDLLLKNLIVLMQNLKTINGPCEIYENSYLDLYPKERLVYLTPHTKHYLNETRSDDIYIIGAFVDKGDGVQASLAKAKEEGLRMAKFPLEKYLLWKKGPKTLTLNNVLNILLDLRYYNNWEMALKSIPSRNLYNLKK